MIDLSWVPESEAVILWRFPPGWTWQDFHAAIDHSWELIHERALPVPVDMILLMDESLRFPPGSPFTAIGRGMRETAKQDGIVVVRVGNQFQQSIINIVRHGIAVVGGRLYGVSTLDDARKQVVRYRQAQAAKKQPTR